MADLPVANTTIEDGALAASGVSGYPVIFSCVGKNADLTPRVYSSTKALLAQHDYSPGADFASILFEDAGCPVIFVGLPIATAGTVGRQNSTGVTGSSAITVTAGSLGFLEETDSIVTVVTGGTIGTTGIVLSVSNDGGFTSKTVRLGTASSYTIPYFGIVLNFAAGTLVAGDVYTFSTTAPMWDGAGISAAKNAVAAQLKPVRKFQVIGDVSNSTLAGNVVTAMNTFETTNKRFATARINVRDRLPLATKAKVTKAVTGSPSLTFAASGFTITRSTGSFLTEGWAIGDIPTITGSTSNNGTKPPITGVTATVMTFASGIVNEGPTAAPTITGTDGLVFTSTTITRNFGSWIADGFRVGDSPVISGTASNNGTKGPITALTGSVLTVASGLTSETIGSAAVTITKGETVAAWVSAMDTAFGSIDGEKRINIGLGRLRGLSPISGSILRRPVQWAAMTREFQHDVQIPTWRKSDQALLRWTNEDLFGNVAEFDERTDGGALAGRFTCARTWGNGPRGAFIALDLTRAAESSLLSRDHNMSVANVACTTVQAETENAIGQVLVLNKNGTGTDASLALIEGRVNTALQMALLQDKGEGQRASSAVWKASRTDTLNVPGAQLNGVLNLLLNGTLEKISTSVRIQTAG